MSKYLPYALPLGFTLAFAAKVGVFQTPKITESYFPGGYYIYKDYQSDFKSINAKVKEVEKDIKGVNI